MRDIRILTVKIRNQLQLDEIKSSQPTLHISPGLITGVGINHEAKIEGEFKLGLKKTNQFSTFNRSATRKTGSGSKIIHKNNHKSKYFTNIGSK